MSSYQVVSPISAEDAPDLGQSNISAYYQETWWRMMWPSFTLEQLIERTANRFPHRLQQNREVQRHQVVKDTATGKIIGYARWDLPESASQEWLEAQVPAASEEEKAKYKEQHDAVNFAPERPELDVLDDWIHEQRKLLAPTVPYIQLDYLGTRPSHQGKGVGTTLIQEGIKQANKLGMDVFLVAMGQKARGMYLKNGFEELSGKVHDLREFGEDDVYETYMMIKHPDAAQKAE